MALRGRPAIYVTVISVRSPIGAELGCKHARLCSREARTWEVSVHRTLASCILRAQLLQSWKLCQI
jgi:hypothetical protein